MKQIRKGCFETNSSSTHCLCIGSKDLVESWKNGNLYLDANYLSNENEDEIKLKSLLLSLDDIKQKLNYKNEELYEEKYLSYEGFYSYEKFNADEDYLFGKGREKCISELDDCVLFERCSNTNTTLVYVAELTNTELDDWLNSSKNYKDPDEILCLSNFIFARELEDIINFGNREKLIKSSNAKNIILSKFKNPEEVSSSKLERLLPIFGFFTHEYLSDYNNNITDYFIHRDFDTGKNLVNLVVIRLNLAFYSIN